MSVRNLSSMFRPKSVAVVGATEREKAVGTVAMRNLMQGGFSGPIMPVNPKHQAVAGVLAYPNVQSLPVVPDLGVICTPAGDVVEAVRHLGERGTRAAIVLTGGLATATAVNGRSVQSNLLDIARRYDMRILGPDSLGLMVPAIGLNASFAHQAPLPGRIAFVSQSGALCSAVLDWAQPKGIGFSHFISLGEAADVDFGDLFDYLGSDPSTRAILLYIELIRQRRNFMSAARAAARNKPVLAIKAGRHDGRCDGRRLAHRSPGGSRRRLRRRPAPGRNAEGLRPRRDVHRRRDAVAFTSDAQHQLGRADQRWRHRVMAVDDLIEWAASWPNCAPATIGKLNVALPQPWSDANPCILAMPMASAMSRHSTSCSKRSEVDSVLVMHAPTALTSASEITEQVIKTVKAHKANVMTCWVGQEHIGAGPAHAARGRHSRPMKRLGRRSAPSCIW